MQYMMLEGAKKALMNEPKPTWLMEISTSEHQPVGVPINPNFAKTFNMFFAHGYRVITADDAATEITSELVHKVLAGRHRLNTHNFLFIQN